MHSSSFCGSWKPQKGHGVVSSSSSDVSGRLWCGQVCSKVKIRRCAGGQERRQHRAKQTHECYKEHRRCRHAHHSPNHSLDLLSVLGVDLVSVLWSHEHGSKAEGRVLQPSPVTFDDCRCQNGHNIYTNTSGETSAGLFKIQIFWEGMLIVCVNSRAGNLLILLLTRMSMRAPFRWSPLFTWIYTKTHI